VEASDGEDAEVSGQTVAALLTQAETFLRAHPASGRRWPQPVQA
jgi:hypothetical protein